MPDLELLLISMPSESSASSICSRSDSRDDSVKELDSSLTWAAAS